MNDPDEHWECDYIDDWLEEIDDSGEDYFYRDEDE